ncbi:MAG: pyruvate synthase, partial [Clostridia bacterium]|nr:pyruvate synthase [Clostridia bacterium]
AYNRICAERCPVHSNIYEPDYVAVLDETLLEAVDVTSGLKKDGAVIINTSLSPQDIRPKLRGWEGSVFTLDARKISEEILGSNFPNTALLAATIKVSGVLVVEDFLSNIEQSFKHKFATKPQVIEGNMKILQRALEEVRQG